MNVTIIQMNVQFKDLRANVETLVRQVETAMQKRPLPDVLVLPELWSCGFVPSPIDEFADDNGEHVQKFLGDLAQKYHVNIVGGSTPVRAGGKIYNRCYVFNRQGETVAHYDKTHLFSLSHEDQIFDKGEELVTFELDGVPSGIAICYDLRFPEVFQVQALHGIKALYILAAWPISRLTHWWPLLRARAIENQIYIIACNAAGTTPGGTQLAGNSGIINPWGEVLTSAHVDSAIIHGTLSSAMFLKVRSFISVYDDRRPDLYQKPIHTY